MKRMNPMVELFFFLVLVTFLASCTNQPEFIIDEAFGIKMGNKVDKRIIIGDSKAFGDSSTLSDNISLDGTKYDVIPSKPFLFSEYSIFATKSSQIIYEIRAYKSYDDESCSYSDYHTVQEIITKKYGKPTINEIPGKTFTKTRWMSSTYRYSIELSCSNEMRDLFGKTMIEAFLSIAYKDSSLFETLQEDREKIFENKYGNAPL